MTKNISKIVLSLLMMLVVIPASAAFKDFKIDLTAYNDASSLLTADEVSNSSNFEFGIAVADDGTLSRVEATDASATAVISGKYHNDHGCTNVKLVVPVEGPVKIGIGNCTYASHTIKVTNSESQEVASFATATGCWSRSKNDETMTFGYYNGAATTLTIVASSYTPAISIQAISAEDIPSNMTVSYSIGESGAEGVVPAGFEVEGGKTFTIPVNSTLFIEGKTLTGWTDGTNTYTIGQEVPSVANTEMTLTPVFTENTVALADRTEATTIKWNFRRDQGATAVGFQNNSGFYVAQANVNGSVIDVKMVIDATSGKFNNQNHMDWCQVNSGTKFIIPSCKGAIVSLESMNATTTSTIEGSTEYTADGGIVSYTVKGTSETVEVVIGDGTWYRSASVVLPVTAEEETSSNFKDFKIDLTAYNDPSSLLTAEEVSSNANFEFGIAVADDGTVSRVGATDASAVAVISGKYHNDHGCTNVKLVVPVEGAVKIGVGCCSYSGHTVKVKDASGTEVTSFDMPKTGCWSRNKSDELVTYGYYSGGATTLTVESSSYTPYISMEKVVEAEAIRPIKLDLTAQGLLTDDEYNNKTNVNFGVVIAEDGTASRVEATDPTANAVISGKYHNDHGWTGVKLVVPVNGPVKIGVGNCSYSGHTVKVSDAAGNAVTSFDIPKTGCWSRNKTDEMVTFGYYKGEATTLTIESSSYTPYIMVESTSAVPTEYTAKFSLGSVTCQGTTVPASQKVLEGESITIPANFTLFVEGQTLTGWTDGKNTYKIGEQVALTADIELTPVFTANEVSLADRTEPVTLKWDFRRDEGAPVVGWQNTTGHVWVTQATINGKTIDVKCDVSTNPGKFNNSNNTDCAQVNEDTKFTIPSCKGAAVSMECHGSFSISTTTIDGQTDYAGTGSSSISYEIANTAETIDIVIGDGSYYKYIQAVLPVVQSTDGKTYNNEAANIVWDLNDVDLYATPNVLTPEGAFTLCTVNTGDFTVGVDAPNAGANNGVKMLKLQPNGDNRSVEFIAKPCKGLTFTATKVSAKVARFGTDGGLLTVTVKNAEGEEAVLASGLIPARNNKDQAGDKHGAEEKYTTEFTYDVPASLATSESFTLVITEEGSLGATKQIGIGDVHIEGTINGTTEAVAKYTISAKANPDNGGSVNVYPNGNEFDAGTELKLTATEKFGFDFVNWTDATGAVLSEEAVYVHTLNDNVELTANFKQVNTYELAITIEGGANDYMVQLAPAPTIVDGKTMYEEGTEVALTAASNAILTFNSWSDGQTSSEIKVNMTENIALTANYSAIDYIVGWDFYRRGNNGRVADFYSTADNEAAQLILTNESGSITGWLDKSTEAANGYESMKGAAVNWQKIGDKYYYQTKINASEFTKIKVQAQMLYNYIAHKTQKIEYSVDGTNWTEAGRATMPAAKTVTDIEATLGEDANNASELYIRFIPDYTSDRDGSGDGDASNDGTSITNIFVTGTMKLVDDGKAPALVSTVPATGAANASANGRVVMTFDEKIKLTAAAKASLNGEELALSASGKAVTAEYKNLSYATEYTFQLAAGSVSDLTDNVLNEAVNVTFTTMTKPTVNKALYDFIVPDDGNFKEALAAAGSRADKSKRFRIFVKQGNHIIPANENSMVTGSDGKSYPDPKTSFGAPNTSIIGEDMALTTVANTMPNDLASNPDAGAGGQANPLEGIRTSGLLYMTSGATNTYFQDITLKTNTPDATGRNVILVDGGNKTICKDVTLWAYQDTYVSDREQSLYYFEGGVIRGRTDFICGSGDVFFNDVDIVMCEQGGYIVAPRANVKYGYVFKDCTLKGEQDNVNGNYFLGRPWTEAAETYYIDCTMEAIPTAAGWTNMSAGGCTRFAEYNSVSASGTTVDLSGRVKELGKENPHSFNPVLSAEEAAEIGNMSNMFGDWDPRQATEQAPVPANVTLEKTTSVMKWNDSNYALLWAICKDGKVVAFTTEPTYTVDDVTATWSVRAANEMGGLGEAAEATLSDATGIESINNNSNVVSTSYYNLNGVKVSKSFKGTVIKIETLNDGKQITTKVIR